MVVRIVSVTVCLLMAGLPASAQQSQMPATPVAAKPAHAPAHRKVAREKSTRTSAVPAAYAAIPDAERLAIQSDLVWLGGYEGMSAEEIDAHTVDAIKAFQRRNNGKETGVLSDQERVLLANAAKRPEAAVGWRLIEDTATGARLGLPEMLVPRAGAGRTGSRWTSGQGQIQIETFRLREASLPVLFEQEKKTAQRRVGFSALGASSFVIAGEQRLKKFVVRAQANGSEVRGVTILYDQATEGTMAPVAIAVSDTFQGFPNPNAGPLPGRNRAVEYATAIVVSSRGHMITAAGGVDQCQSITVPGVGHADRVAVDKTGDVALLRLYGARNLVPVALAVSAGGGDQFTLFGIADPLGQAGDGKVTNVPARLTPQGIDPMPQLGFSGAAAIDAQGHFAGMVELKAAVVAGTNSAAPQALLVPAETVHAFLQAQGVAAGTAHAATDQSIVRVICVRK
jgi:Putative peptidoglycan binding domain/Trypsin-like peptidase domain